MCINVLELVYNSYKGNYGWTTQELAVSLFVSTERYYLTKTSAIL